MSTVVPKPTITVVPSGRLSALSVALALCGLLAGCASRFDTPLASGHYTSSPKQCVPYARDVSGIYLYGDACTWWDQVPAERRGTVPVPGAILSLTKTPRLTHGHLAVVTNVVGPRAVDVTQSNWGNDNKTRRIIYERQRAIDVSALNDWSQVEFWNMQSGGYGSPYPALGFIYKNPASVAAPQDGIAALIQAPSMPGPGPVL